MNITHFSEFYLTPQWLPLSRSDLPGASDSDPVPLDQESPNHQATKFQSSSSGFTLQQVIFEQMVRSLLTIIRDNFLIEWLVSLPGAEIDQAGGA